jgi:hypothetical protein
VSTELLITPLFFGNDLKKNITLAFLMQLSIFSGPSDLCLVAIPNRF